MRAGRAFSGMMEALMPAPTTALDARIARLEREMLAFLRRRVGPDAEEVAQDVWLRVATSDPDCADDAAFRAYVYVVARRLLIDRYRKKRLDVVPIDDATPPSAPADAHSAVAAANLAALVQRTLDQMRPEQAEVFWMRTNDGVSFKEIAERQDCSINTALGRMHTVVKRLKVALAAEGWS